MEIRLFMFWLSAVCGAHEPRRVKNKTVTHHMFNTKTVALNPKVFH